jgi:transcriptional antiterminator
MEALGDNFEYVSISTLAKRLGVSGQTIRNRIKEGFYETMCFKRGDMNGILIKVRKWQDQKESAGD